MQWYKRSRKGDYSGLDTWDGWRRKDYQMQLYMDNGHVEGKRSRGIQKKAWMDIGQCQGRAEREKHRLDQEW